MFVHFVYGSLCRHDGVGVKPHFLSVMASPGMPAVVATLKRHIVRALVVFCQTDIQHHLCNMFCIHNLHEQQRLLSSQLMWRQAVSTRFLWQQLVHCSFFLCEFLFLFIYFSVQSRWVVQTCAFICRDDFNLCCVCDFLCFLFLFVLCCSGFTQWHNGSFLQWHWFVQWWVMAPPGVYSPI